MGNNYDKSCNARINNGILGLIAGDALGVPVEFKDRESLKQQPVTGMIGYGTYNQPPGTWSDDSSLTLCLAEELTKEFSLENLGHSFLKWQQEKHWTAREEVFDIGITTSHALYKIRNSTPPEMAGESGEHNNGNGSLMRILPLLHLSVGMEGRKQRYELVKAVSSITHAHQRSCLSCFYYLEFAAFVLHHPEASLTTAYAAANYSLDALMSEIGVLKTEADHFRRLLKGNLMELPEEEIRSTGYVIDCLEASTWCLLTSNSYKEAVLKAVNLGEDTDTTAAVTGGIAGIYYGRESIPEEWISQLARIADIEELLRQLQDSQLANSGQE